MSTTTATPLFGNVTATRAANLPVPVKIEDPKVSSAIAQLVASNSLVKMDDNKVVLFGVEKQKATAQALDGILVEVTKGNSPVLFELFKQLSKGVEEADLPALEAKIRDSLARKWWHSILDSVGLSSVAKRLEKANDKIGSMLTSKAATIKTITDRMEQDMQTQAQDLIAKGQQLNKLAAQFRRDIDEFTIISQAADQILAQGKIELQNRMAEATASGDPLKVEDAKRFEQKVQLFESRSVVLHTILTRAPAELESIRLTQGAALTTLGEVAVGALAEFNQIKSTLIQLSTAHGIQSNQALTEERRKLAALLTSHGTNTLATVASNAAKSLGENRVRAANELLTFATNINTISKTVAEEHRQNKTRYEEARNKLGEVKKLLAATDTVVDV